MRLNAIALIALSLFTVKSVFAQPVNHTVSFNQPNSHYLEVETTFTANQNQPQIMIAAWTPGSYLIREYARNIDELTAYGSGNRTLSLNKISKNRWQISASTGDEIRLSYRVYAREMSVRTSWLEDGFAFINPASVFLIPADGLEKIQDVRFRLPKNWQVAVALEKTGGAYRAENYDQLVDSPFILGKLITDSFKSEGRTHHLVSVGDLDYWDHEKASQDLKTIVQAQYDLWGFFPYPDQYHFLNVVSESRGGLEHNRSTMIMAHRWQMRKREDYVKWLELSSHEFFHAWNVRKLRPDGLQKYDYENENYTRGLWLSEGFTSYYAPLFLARSGLIQPQEYFKTLAGRLRSLETTPGRKVRSAETASFDAWIKHYRPNENSVNSNISYYTKGAIIGFVMDIEIRKRTDNRFNLDDLMRQTYSRYSESGFNSQQIAQIAGRLTNSDWQPWFERYVSGTEELPVNEAFEWLGLEFSRVKEEPKEKDKAIQDPDPSDLGVTIDSKDGRIMVKTVPTDSAGFKAGLNVGDEIIAINQIRVLPDDWEKLWQRIRIGEKIEILAARRNQISSFQATTQAAVAKEWKIKLPKQISQQHRARLQSWMGEQWFNQEVEKPATP